MNKYILIVLVLILCCGVSYCVQSSAVSIEQIHEPAYGILVIPTFETELWTMGLFNQQSYILYLENASSYIIPDNEVVLWYANNTILTDNGLLWKHDSSVFEFNYVSDNDLFENLTYGDMWQNPDYYLTHDRMGDCEDFSLAYASILEAKGIHAQVLGVTLTNGWAHWVVKYQYNNRTNYADINRNNVIIKHDVNDSVYKELVLIDRNNITML